MLIKIGPPNYPVLSVQVIRSERACTIETRISAKNHTYFKLKPIAIIFLRYLQTLRRIFSYKLMRVIGSMKYDAYIQEVAVHVTI